MSMIQVENLSFSYGSNGDPIFENVSFTIDTDWKLGFVGRNGRGKTTFLKLLMGEYEYGGRITASVPFDYFPYPVPEEDRLTGEVLEEVCPEAEEWERLRELSLLEVDSDALWRPFSTLSNGERTKVLLAALFLRPGRFLLLDEPTNHLDLAARESVAAYLEKKKGFLLVSHDRRVLDRCVDHILALNRRDIQVRSGNFSSWMANFEEQQASEAAQRERLRKDVRRLETAARRSAAWSDRVEASKTGALDKGYVGHKAAKMMKRSKAIEARRDEALERAAGLLQNQEKEETLKLSPLVHYADVLVRLEEVAPVYDGRPVCAPVTLALRRGERLFLTGKNGSGKSSLLKLLLGVDIAHTGRITTASGLVVSYVSQDTADLRGSLRDYARGYELDESIFLAILRKMDFTRVQFEKDLSEYSGGQKKKVLIARSLCQRAHLYIWDEPLNFIDIYSRRQIEALILACGPAMLLVEHDRAFQEAVGTGFLELQPPRGGD